MLDLYRQLSEKESVRLINEQIIWLTTVRSDGLPMPTPVWYLWDGETFLIYSQPNQQKLRNIEVHPKVALNLNSDEWGENVFIVTGTAEVDRNAPPALLIEAYIQKYRQGISAIQMTPESFSRAFSVAIRVRPERLRKW